MKIRTPKVPFSKIVPDPEIEFGPDDYLIIRPMFSLPKGEIAQLTAELTSLTPPEDDQPETPEQRDRGETFACHLLAALVQEWSLNGPDGPISMPKTPEEFRQLPGIIAGALAGFLLNFRPDSPNPTTGG